MPNVNWNRWFGFYNPGRAMPSVPKPTLEALAIASRQPLITVAQARDFLRSLGAAIPTYQAAVQPIEEGRIGLKLGDLPVPGMMETMAGQKTLVLPRGQAAGGHFRHLLSLGGNLADPPEGVEIPPIPTGGDRETIRKGLRDRYHRNVALGMTFFFQIALEMSALELFFDEPGEEQGYIGATEVALFGILREEGLEGMAAAYPRFMVPSLKGLLDRHFEQQVDLILESGGGSVTPWSPPQKGDRPDLPRTLLDDKADRHQRHARGLFTKEEVPRLPPERLRAITALAQRPVRRVRDIRIIIDLLREAAPKLAEKILPAYDEGRVRIELTRKDVGQPAFMTISLKSLVGLPEEEVPVIYIVEGRKIADVFPEVVMYLASLIMPEEVRDPPPIPNPSGSLSDQRRIETYLERSFARRDIWNYTAFFELVHEVAKSGSSLPVPARQVEMRRVLEECGYLVLCEQWHRFTNPATLQMMRAQFRMQAMEISRAIMGQPSA